MSIVTSVLAGVLVVASMFLVHKVKELKLGEYSSRLVAALFAIFVYFSVAVDYVGFDYVFWYAKWLAPSALVALAGYYAYRIYQDWENEASALLKDSSWLFFSALLLLAARYLFSFRPGGAG